MRKEKEEKKRAFAGIAPAISRFNFGFISTHTPSLPVGGKRRADTAWGRKERKWW